MAKQAGQSPAALPIDGVQPALRYAVGDHAGVHSVWPHRLLHVAAYGRDMGRVPKPVPIDAVERVRVVRVPQKVDAVLPASPIHQATETCDGLRRVPFLTQHDETVAPRYPRLEDLRL